MNVLAIVDDLLFQAKLESAAAHTKAHLTIVRDLAVLNHLHPQSPWQLIIVDLNLTACDVGALLGTLRQLAPTALLVGYAAHVQQELFARARHAGCTVVWPRSVFVQQLPALFKGTSPLPQPKNL